MSTKDLFDKGHSLKTLKNKSQNSMAEELDSGRHIEAHRIQRDRYVPEVDFKKPSNFARFGLAELYYEDSIKRIYQTYPYDGSLTEKIEWENESTYLDLFIFENEYPRTNGFVTFNISSHSYTSTKSNSYYSSSAPQYIYFTGGPHPDPNGNYKNNFSAGSAQSNISKANIYHTASQRSNNLEIDPEKGITVEFWMKKDGWGPNDSAERIFDISATGSSADNYGRLGIYCQKSVPGKISFQARSGSANSNFSADTGLTGGPEGGLADGNWHHYAFALKRVGSDNVIKFYIDGAFKQQIVDSTPISAVDGTLVASIAALAGPLSGSSGMYAEKGWGNLVSSSIDEFRYWKTERNAQQIGRFYKDQVGGGTNTDNSKYNKHSNLVDLGVYFKFNEGITQVASTDSTILDYSGRISNGEYIGYTSDSRTTGSAMVLSKAAEREAWSERRRSPSESRRNKIRSFCT